MLLVHHVKIACNIDTARVKSRKGTSLEGSSHGSMHEKDDCTSLCGHKISRTVLVSAVGLWSSGFNAELETLCQADPS